MSLVVIVQFLSILTSAVTAPDAALKITTTEHSIYLSHEDSYIGVVGGNITSAMISQWEGSGSTCPTWFYSGPGGCQCGDPLHGACICDSETERVYLSVCYCMTYSEDTNDTVTSSCLLSCFSADRNSTFFGVPQNVSELNEMMCSNMNRDGQLCGSCKDGFALPVYSYSTNHKMCPPQHLVEVHSGSIPATHCALCHSGYFQDKCNLSCNEWLCAGKSDNFNTIPDTRF